MPKRYVGLLMKGLPTILDLKTGEEYKGSGFFLPNLAAANQRADELNKLESAKSNYHKAVGLVEAMKRYRTKKVRLEIMVSNDVAQEFRELDVRSEREMDLEAEKPTNEEKLRRLIRCWKDYGHYDQ